MRTLHRVILKMLPAPFFAALVSLIFILLMQFLMRHMRDLIGKGLSTSVLLEIIAYNLSYMVVLAVPMSALVASLVVFGRLSESGYYRVAKGSGISLPQLVWPVWIVAAGLVFFMMYFNNEVLPESNYRAKSLWYDIRQSKPAFGLEPGVFYDGVAGYSIRAAEIDPIEGRLKGITVFDHSEDQTGRVTLSARAGRLESENKGTMINLILEDGEMHRYVTEDDDETYERLEFGVYKIPLDLRNVAFERTDLTATSRSDRTTRSSKMIELVRDLEDDIEKRRNEANDDLRSWPASGRAGALLDSTEIDTSRLALLERATVTVREHRSTIQELASATTWASRRANRFRVEIHKKFSIAFACFVFVLIGIPLGLRVRRGGLGVVSGLSLGIFIVYWVSLVQGEKLADRGFLDPWIGMWIANILIGSVAVALFISVSKDLKHRRMQKASKS